MPLKSHFAESQQSFPLGRLLLLSPVRSLLSFLLVVPLGCGGGVFGRGRVRLDVVRRLLGVEKLRLEHHPFLICVSSRQGRWGGECEGSENLNPNGVGAMEARSDSSRYGCQPQDHPRDPTR